jgi:hypothetical protein
VLAVDGVTVSAVMVAVAVVDNADGLASVAVIVAVPALLPAVNTHEVVFVQVFWKLPSPVPPQFTGAFAVRVRV